MLKKKNIMGLEELIKSAEDLGVKFKMCQVCFDAMGLSIDDLIVPNVDVKGAAAYAKDTMEANVNLCM
jgi:peroxiredoxin family protein